MKSIIHKSPGMMLLTTLIVILFTVTLSGKITENYQKQDKSMASTISTKKSEFYTKTKVNHGSNAVVVVLPELALKEPNSPLSDSYFKESIYGEFRLPVYQRQNVAGLHLYNDRKDKKDHLVRIELHERYTNTLVQEARNVNLKSGENIIKFKLDELKNGEYAASVIDVNDRNLLIGSDDSLRKDSKFRRLLRLNRLDETKSNPSITQMTGEKMFFPDGHYLEEYSNINFSGAQAKLQQVVKPNSVPDGFIRHGQQIFLDNTGKLNIPFYTVDRLWSTESKKEFIAVQSDEDKEKWIVSEMNPSQMSKKVNLESPLISTPSAAAKPDWDIKYKNGETPVFRFYDPKRDGEVNLNQVFFVNTRKYEGTTQDNENVLDWKIITPPKSSTWPVWYKSPGEAILLTKTHLLQDGPVAGEFEEITSSNDNYVGQWLSDDGKLLSFAKGRVLKRYPPFTAPYDNLPLVSRIISIISTTDGINWKYSYMIPPDETDPPIAQHYGAKVNRVPNGNGLMMAFVYRYRAKSQQISVELAYSWDGASWHRFAGQPAFAENGDVGSWNSGMIMISDSAVAQNGTVHQLLSWVPQGFHFYYDVYTRRPRPNIEEVTGKWLENFFKGRELENWPFFNYFGSYESIAKDIRTTGVSVGIASYREGGLFSMSAQGAESGSFVSRAVMASNSLSANVEIGKTGSLLIELIDKAGSPLQGYTKEVYASDDLAVPIFNKLPDVPFRIRAKLKDAKLFSLNF